MASSQIVPRDDARRWIRPTYDVRQTEDAFLVVAEVPGVAKGDVKTILDNDDLTLEARRSWRKPERWQVLQRETVDADYRLVLKLDRRVDRDAIKAELVDGIISLRLPKSEIAKQRTIAIEG